MHRIYCTIFYLFSTRYCTQKHEQINCLLYFSQYFDDIDLPMTDKAFTPLYKNKCGTPETVVSETSLLRIIVFRMCNRESTDRTTHIMNSSILIRDQLRRRSCAYNAHTCMWVSVDFFARTAGFRLRQVAVSAMSAPKNNTSRMRRETPRYPRSSQTTCTFRCFWQRCRCATWYVQSWPRSGLILLSFNWYILKTLHINCNEHT